MGDITICLELTSHDRFLPSDAQLEADYKSIYKKLFSFLYSHPHFLMSFCFSGQLLAFFQDKHPESLEILRALVARRQIELLGSGYYDPILPLLFPADRSGQIEKMNAELRNAVGKRPRGMTLFGCIWEPSLVTSIQSCGMEYIHLDSSLIPSTGRCFYPVITGEQGKNVKILPVYSAFLPEKNEDGEHWIARIKKNVAKGMVEGAGPLISLLINSSEFCEFFNSPIFAYIEKLSSSASGEGITFTLPQTYLKTAHYFVTTYVPAGMDWQIAKWARKAYQVCDNKTRFPLTVYDFLNTYKASHKLYERMMYVSMIISQLHGGDKMRKKMAKEKLWEAQCGFNYIGLPYGLPPLNEWQQQSFCLLNESEKLIRENAKNTDFCESITSYDYNGDGINEYVCQLKEIHTVVSRLAAQITEFDVISKGANYASSLSRTKDFDGVGDTYNKGFFVDHFLSGDKVDDYLNTLTEENGIFSKVIFEEKKFDSRKNEIHFFASTAFSKERIPVTLLKKYIILNDSISVQYILKNEGKTELNGVFAVETNFAKTYYDRNISKQYSCEVVFDGNLKMLNSDDKPRLSSGVSALRITDLADKLQFNFEPNEDVGFALNTVSFNRPNPIGEVQESSQTLVAVFFWDVKLSPERSAEKTINFAVTNIHGKR